jgi:hypothetical protein
MIGILTVNLKLFTTGSFGNDWDSHCELKAVHDIFETASPLILLSNLMACSVHSEDPESFSDRLVTGDELWFHCHTTEKSNNSSSFQSSACELARTMPKTALLNPSDCYRKDYESILISEQSMRSVLKCDNVAVIVTQPVLQGIPNYF